MTWLIPDGSLDHERVPLQEQVFGLVISRILQKLQGVAVVDNIMLRLIFGRTLIVHGFQPDSIVHIKKITLNYLEIVDLRVIKL